MLGFRWLTIPGAVACVAFAWVIERTDVDRLPPPRTGEARIVGVVHDVDPANRTLTVMLRAVHDHAGNETKPQRPTERVVSVSRAAHLHRLGQDEEWLKLSELPNGADVTIYARASSNNKPWAVRRVIVSSDVEIPRKEVKGARPVLMVERPPMTASRAYDRVCMDDVVVPMVYPVAGGTKLVDTFLYPRDGGRRRHHGQDLMAPKMTPLLACFDGIVRGTFNRRTGHFIVSVIGDSGWTAMYMHLNNDTPGTDDGSGGPQFAFAPGITAGTRVQAGDHIGYVGDSGNAEGTPPHLHFELWSQTTGAVYNAYPSLAAALQMDTPGVQMVMPDLRPGDNEIRVDGLIVDVDPQSNTLVINRIAMMEPFDDLRATTRPTRVTVRFKGPIEVRDAYGAKVEVDDIALGWRIQVVGRPVQGEEVLLASVAVSSMVGTPDEFVDVLTALMPEVNHLQLKMAKLLLDPINEARRNAGLQPVEMDVSLIAGAQKAADAAMLEGQPIFDGQEAGEARSSGFLGGDVQGLFGGGPDDPNTIVERWLLTPEKRAVLLDPVWTTAGIGYAFQDPAPSLRHFRHNWVVYFGRPDTDDD